MAKAVNRLDAALDRRLANPRSRTHFQVRGMIKVRLDKAVRLVDALASKQRHTTMIVRHGADADASRPTWSGTVIWIGSVAPVNIEDRDLHWTEAQ
ncbi:hypothetical protein BJ980_002157 [Nocardioides daedukensis]|uniref:Uncharacterized protein n=1 Tax=Nocardioides daedukensis TaxID=634462 RepID=A0A7Y9UTV1_9ACTN|nr:hypothetical protein [Nocardioides daedukensis]NYG59234.1 hypothetical protein [Nocardioides daedukensis]